MGQRAGGLGPDWGHFENGVGFESYDLGFYQRVFDWMDAHNRDNDHLDAGLNGNRGLYEPADFGCELAKSQ